MNISIIKVCVKKGWSHRDLFSRCQCMLTVLKPSHWGCCSTPNTPAPPLPVPMLLSVIRVLHDPSRPSVSVHTTFTLLHAISFPPTGESPQCDDGWRSEGAWEDAASGTV